MVDARDGGGLPRATVVLLGTEFGGYADGDGVFVLRGVPAGRYDLLASFVGYRARIVRDIEAESSREIEIALEPTAIELPDLVVSAIRRPQIFAEAPISMAVAGIREIAAHNSLSLSGPLSEMAGVNMVGDQVNIRGSSGFSRGTGSRVLMLVDGTPLMSADLGDVKWDVIPVQQVERVEVIKGAGSALYGTGALGGVINVITRNPSASPRTRFRLLSGLYSQPAHRAWRWTDGPMYATGLDVSHSRTLGDTGLLFSAGHQRGNGYHENDDFRRLNLFAKTVHHFSPTTYWRTTGIYAVDDHGIFVQWKDRTEPLAVPDGDEKASTISSKFNLNSEFYHLRGRDLGFHLKGYYYRTEFDNSRAAGELASSGHKIGGEFQSDYTGWDQVDLTVGTAGIFDRVRSPGDFWGKRSILNLALYGQGVYEPRVGVEIIGGLRYDWHRRGGDPGNDGTGSCPAFGRVKTSVERQVSPQVGISYRPRVNTTLRASVGRGFRAPSVSEIYIQAQVSGLKACPNPEVEAESSWSYEVGINQLVGGAMAFDLALFWNTYQGLIEGRADVAAGSAIPVARFRNLSRARIRGLEVEQRMALPYGLRLRTAYTYLDAVEFLGEDEVLPPYCQGDLVPGEEAPLPYRPEHLLHTGLMAVRGSTQAGISFRYMSAFERVSGLFPECDRDHIPVKLVDAFLTYTRGLLQYNLRVDNLLQYHYALTERKIRSPRKVSLTVSGAL